MSSFRPFTTADGPAGHGTLSAPAWLISDHCLLPLCPSLTAHPHHGVTVPGEFLGGPGGSGLSRPISNAREEGVSCQGPCRATCDKHLQLTAARAAHQAVPRPPCAKATPQDRTHKRDAGFPSLWAAPLQGAAAVSFAFLNVSPARGRGRLPFAS